MSNIRYLLDENVDPTVRTELLNFDSTIDVIRIGDPGVPELSTPDEEILEWIEESGYVLVTHNRKSMPDHLRHHFG